MFPRRAKTTFFEAIGGTECCRRLSANFYRRVQGDPVLRPLFPGKTMTCAIEEFAAFLVQFLGGPAEDTQRRWWLSLRESHKRFKIGPKEREAWMQNMCAALDEVIAEPARSAMVGFFFSSSAYIAHQPDTGRKDLFELNRRWDTQLGLDDAVAAIGAGEPEHALEAVKSLTLDPSVMAMLLATMYRSRDGRLRSYVQESLTQNHAPVHAYFANHTLLHEAAGHADLAMVEFLLGLGADATGGYYSPLYWLANAKNIVEGADVVRALVRAGASVNTEIGSKRCTALHMAARRGNLCVAEALLQCGANIDAQDSQGDTPLRRAVNCDRDNVAALLIARGADKNLVGSKGLTPSQAARSSKMRAIVHDGG